MNPGHHLEDIIAKTAKRYNVIGIRTTITFGKYYPQQKHEIDLLLAKKGWRKDTLIYGAVAYRNEAVSLTKVKEDIQKIEETINLFKYFFLHLIIIDSRIPGIDWMRKKDYELWKKSKHFTMQGTLKMYIQKPKKEKTFALVVKYKNQWYAIKELPKNQKRSYQKTLQAWIALFQRPKIYYFTNKAYTQEAAAWLAKKKIRYFTLKEWKKHNR